MKTPFITDEKLSALTKQYSTPFHLYDEAGIRKTARALNQAFGWAPNFKEYFAVKATPTPAILKILQEEGCGFDCASGVELELVKRLGARGDDIMFTSNDTAPGEFAQAAELGATLTLDAIELIPDMMAEIGVPETVSLRYNPGGIFAMGTEIMDMPEESKFGMTRAQVIAGVADLAARGTKNFGLHAFLASNTLTNEYYATLARVIFELVLEIREKTGVTLDFVNLSGGIGIAYKPDETPNDIAVIGEKVHAVYDELLVANGISNLQIVTELGRFMLAPNGHLITKVLHLKRTYRDYVGTDATAANLMRPAIYGAYHHISVMGKENAPHERLYDVTGSLCENKDKFAIQRQLPEIAVGDILVIHDTGAHGAAMGYQYNGKLRSAEILLQENGETRMIRRAETLDDYFATMVFENEI
ncbi:MAG: diaminopimelate decarboxylase [Streptococcaceae bacterium]|jgi:diaminopimelate decarboxylase|nr:diaminopimelate decarboxylase [Streptococcaceae bacterium]